jgi:hypothetical protein
VSSRRLEFSRGSVIVVTPRAATVVLELYEPRGGGHPVPRVAAAELELEDLRALVTVLELLAYPPTGRI